MPTEHIIYCQGHPEDDHCGRPIHLTIEYGGGMEVVDVSYHEECGHRFSSEQLTYMVATDPEVRFEDAQAFADFYNPDEEGYP